MSVVGEMVERKERPAFVRFERRAVPDKQAEAREGRYMSKDVDYALVTPPYSRDVFVQKAEDWLTQVRRDAEKGRIPMQWLDYYRESYERWKRNEEMPLNGTPIKGWPVISPAQQQNLIALNIRTVEDLAAVNDEGLRRIGMGAVSLKNKANAWLSQAKDKGPLTMENASLKAEVSDLKTRNDQLEARLQDAMRRLAVLEKGGLEHGVHIDREPEEGIAASDILDEPAPPKRGRRKAAAQPEEPQTI